MGVLEGRVALVTGAGQGIGRAVAEAFAREGADVAVLDLEEAKAEAAAAAVRAAGRGALPLVLDVATRAACEQAVARCVESLGGLDVLVHAAAWAPPGVFLTELDDARWQRVFDVCLRAAFWLMQAAHPALASSGRGAVIHFASQAGSEGMAGNAAYAAAKEGLRGLCRSAAREWGRDGIRVNMIRPVAASPSFVSWAEAFPRHAEAQRRAIPLGRFGDCAADVAPVAVFLASDAARYLTAVTLPADGGAGGER